MNTKPQKRRQQAKRQTDTGTIDRAFNIRRNQAGVLTSRLRAENPRSSKQHTMCHKTTRTAQHTTHLALSVRQVQLNGGGTSVLSFHKSEISSSSPWRGTRSSTVHARLLAELCAFHSRSGSASADVTTEARSRRNTSEATAPHCGMVPALREWYEAPA